MRICWILVALGMAAGAMAAAGRPLAGLEQSAPNLIRADGWGVVGEGKPEVAEDVLVTDHGVSARPQGGYVQAVELNQTHPVAIVAKAWSRGMSISGEADSGYSLYLDIIFQDGTPLWGQQQPFRTGTQDWHLAEVKVFPSKPIKRVSVYLLMRNRAGRAEFKDISLREAGAMKDLCWLDGQLIRPTRSESAGTLVRDVLGDTGYLSAEEAKGRGLDLMVAKDPDGLTRVTVTDTTGTDRALTVLHTVPVGEGNWRWWSTLSDAVEARAGQEYVNGRRQPAGNGILSRYPVGWSRPGRRAGHWRPT